MKGWCGRFGRASGVALALAATLLSAAATARAEDPPLKLWHAYTGVEEAALKASVAAFEAAHPNVRVETLAVAYGAYASKLESAIPGGQGPDVFIDSHERLANYLELALIRPFSAGTDVREFETTVAETLVSVGQRYGLPLSTKCAALFVNTRLLPEPPASLEALLALRGKLGAGVYPLAFATDDAYFLSAFLHAFGGRLVDDKNQYAFQGKAAEQTLTLVSTMLKRGDIPAEASTDLVKKLFLADQAATIISGPWFAADVPPSIPFTVVSLPVVEAADGARMQPFLTVEAVFLAKAKRPNPAAEVFAAFLAGPAGSRIRARVGHQVVAARSAWEDADIAGDPLLVAFRDAASTARPMSTAMRPVWEPAQRAIRKVIRGDTTIPMALEEGRRRFEVVTQPLPSPRSPMFALLLIGVGLLLVAGYVLRRAQDASLRARFRASVPAYAYVAHAFLIVGLLVILPLLVGVLTSFFAGRGGDFHYVGLANYIGILTNRGEGLLASGSFWLVLCVTVLWTAVNLALHVGIGVGLALLLHSEARKLRPLYRVLLVLPWAVPSYVTALAWKGMFHRQFGAMNAILAALGAEPIGWFDRWSTAFAANVATNVWLGFPFMMVVTLGALTTIPKELYEAAEVDGASPWQRFRMITVPLLRPVLAPAVAMGAVWTFNMFNVVFLVSGGEPDGSTEILVSEAYRWAFTRSGQYGYAAAYAVLIFGVLVLGTRTPAWIASRRRRAAP